MLVSSLANSSAVVPDAYSVSGQAWEAIAPQLNRLESEFDDRAVRDRSVQDRYRTEVGSLLSDSGQSVLKYVDGRLRGAPHWALVRGLPPQFARALLVGLIAALGTLEERSAKRTAVVMEIRPGTRRGSSTKVLDESLHTDSAGWPNPNDLTCLFCVRPDQFGGGASRLLSVESLFSALQRTDSGARALSFLQNTKVAWRRAPEFGGGFFEDFVFQDSKVRWLRDGIREEIDGPAETLRASLDEVERTIETATECENFFMQPGDLLIVDNKRCLHARTPIPSGEQSQRLLLRAKIRLHQTGIGTTAS